MGKRIFRAGFCTMNIQISFMSEGGSDTPTPDLSIEVDDLNAALERMQAAGFPIEYGPAEELGRSALLSARSLREARHYPHPPPLSRECPGAGAAREAI